MSQDPALEDLRQFLLAYITTYEELDVLLLLVRGSGDSWSAKAVGEALEMASEDCRKALESLVARGLLAVGSESAKFRYTAMTQEIADSVELLERTYREQRASVAMLMSANALERVRTAAIRTFAEAFRLKGPRK